MNDLAPLITDLAIMLGIASVVILVFQKIRQPVVLGYIIVGMRAAYYFMAINKRYGSVAYPIRTWRYLFNVRLGARF